MIIVTGGAGFIGANLVKGLNDRGVDDILVVDNMTNVEKIRNLADCRISDYMDKQEFLGRVERGESPGKVQALLHEGACSDTMASDGRYVMDNNFRYSRSLYRFCGEHRVQFIYASSASVYGAGATFEEQPEYELPLNAYAYSKLLFDQYVRKQQPAEFQCVGLRYFNVYGDREQHKGRMASVAYHFFHQYRKLGKVRLFEGSAGYANGEQRRDFVSVEDVVKVNMFLLEHPQISGIFNVGTGRSQSFNDVALAVVNSLRQESGQGLLTLEAAQEAGAIEYIPMPEALAGKYQSFTEANIEALRGAGYEAPLFSVEEGVARYVDRLREKAEGA